MILSRFQINKSKSIFLLLCLFALSLNLFSQNNSKPKKELENKKQRAKRINEEISQINEIIKETAAHKKTSIGTLININLKIEKRQDLINTINAEIADLNKEIKENEKRSQILKTNLEKLKADYAGMIVFAQRNQDSYSKLMFIFASSDFNQAYSRLKYFQQYSEFRKKQAKEIIETQTQLIANLKELKEQRHEKNVLLGNEQQEKQSLDEEKGEQEQVLTALQQKEKDLKKELEKKRQESVELQIAIKKLIAQEIERRAKELAEEAATVAAKKEAEAKKKKAKEKIATTPKIKEKTKEKEETHNVASVKPEVAPKLELSEVEEALSEDFANNRGRLPWPVAKGVICEGYGEHEHPAIKGFMIVNNGVEICATKGTQVRTIFEGQVTGIALSPTGGKLVIVKHGEYLSVYCNLSEVNVKKGQKVAVKEIIGTMLYDEDESKSSMNFQIWKGTRTMDPSGWLFMR